MSVVVRGVKNAFRSGARAVAVILILAVSMGLALAMLLANQAVKDRLTEVKSSIGTTVTINPAGSAGFQGGGEPLTDEIIAKLDGVEHISAVNSSLSLMLNSQSDNDSNNSFRFNAIGGSGLKQGETNLVSPVDPGTLGHRMQGLGADMQVGDGDIKLPLRMIGVSGSADEQGNALNITSGRTLESSDTNSAVIGANLAEKNSLDVGSTFTAYSETFTVVGIFETDTQYGDSALYVPLATAQRLGEAGGEVSSTIVTIDSVDNVESTVANIKETLGEDVADVTTNEENALTAVEGLRSVEKISLIGFAIALVAAAIIIFLTMLMIVRERRREIGVLKAIGGSNRSIITQFVTEAVVLVMMSATLGMGIAAVSSNSIAGALVSSNTSSSSSSDAPDIVSSSGRPSGGAGAQSFKSVHIGHEGHDMAPLSSAKDLIGNVTTNVSGSTLGAGLLAAVVIAVLGSAIPAWLVTKIRPAEVLRGE